MPPRIIPVIHYAGDEQALRNAERCFAAGCDGVLVIEMHGRNAPLVPIAKTIKERWPEMLVGINMLGEDPEAALAASMEAGLDMTWTDEQITHTSDEDRNKALRLGRTITRDKKHILFSAVAFKHQRHEPNPVVAAQRAMFLGFIPTTSGPATGVPAELDVVGQLRDGIGWNASLAIASGVTPDNAARFAHYVTHILVATGVSSSFHELDPHELARLMAAVGRAGEARG